jgi:arylsulfatase A-like enzyme
VRSVRPAAGALAILLVLGGCGRVEQRRRNVVVILIDTLRADKLGAYGNRRGLTPFLDTLAERGTVFERTYATSSWTIPSVASLFTSRYATQHRVVTFGSQIRSDEVTLAERLAEAGWLGGGFAANPNLQARFGYAQGFAEWWADVKDNQDVDGNVLRAQALSWIDRTWNRVSDAPALLYVHYMEPHSPYEPPEPFRGRFAVDDAGKPVEHDPVVATLATAVRANVEGKTPPQRADVLLVERLYDAEVAAVDDQVHRLFDELARRGFLAGALVVVTADHGEEFLEHGGLYHGRTLYEESVRVPLIVVGSGIPAGRRVKTNVSLVYLAPTVLDVLGLPAEPRFEGHSLVPLFEGDDGDHRDEDIVLELEPGHGRLDLRFHVRGLVRGRRKFLVGVSGRPELYDLTVDAGESRISPPAGDALPAMAWSLAAAEGRLAEHAAREALQAPLDEKLERRLRGLGYVE